jgi:uncharacterized protein DUF3563
MRSHTTESGWDHHLGLAPSSRAIGAALIALSLLRWPATAMLASTAGDFPGTPWSLILTVQASAETIFWIGVWLVGRNSLRAALARVAATWPVRSMFLRRSRGARSAHSVSGIAGVKVPGKRLLGPGDDPSSRYALGRITWHTNSPRVIRADYSIDKLRETRAHTVRTCKVDCPMKNRQSSNISSEVESRDIVDTLRRWWRRQDEKERYLAAAADLVDLERRMRALDRQATGPAFVTFNH